MSEQAENSLSLSDFGNENLNLEQQSNSNISTSQSSKKKRKAIEPRSVVWSHFTRYTKDEKPRAYCNHCKKDYAANTSVNGTSMLKNHMEGCMKNPYNNETHVTKLNQQPSSVGGGIDNRNELDKYIAEDRERNGDEFDILKWWKMNAQRFPILSQMACDIFAVPVSTVASESAFSMGGRVIDSYRSSLTPRMVQCLMCTKDWLRNEAYPINIEEDMDMLEKIDEEFGNLANETSILDI